MDIFCQVILSILSIYILDISSHCVIMENRIKEFRERQGLTMQQLADLANTTAPQINKLEKGQRKLTLDWMERLAPHLGVKASDFIVDVAKKIDRKSIKKSLDKMIVKVDTRPSDGRIPLISHQKKHGKNNKLIGTYVDNPITLDCIALEITTSDMYPRLRHGETIFINQNQTPDIGQDCAFFLKNKDIIIREFHKKTATHYLYRQLNPEKTDMIALQDVEKVCAIVARG